MKHLMGPTLAVAVILTASQSCQKAHLREPGNTPKDTNLALTQPDEYAWQLFFFLNHPAERGKAGKPDERKRFGQVDSDTPVVWETWALSSGGLDESEVFKRNGAPPLRWDQLDRGKNRLVLDENLEMKMLEKSLARAKGRKATRKVFFPPNPDDKEEVRMNECTFEAIVRNKMYTRDGLEDLLEEAKKAGDRSLISSRISPCSKEVKAEWLPITESDKPRYLWRYLDVEGKHQIWGLVALHISTKDLPNWFWADFGHRDCERQLRACDQLSAAITNPVDRTTRGLSGTGPSGSDGVRTETRGTVWENYILRGTQTSYTTITGSKVVLSNPVIENTNQESSCMTCHATAAIGPRIKVRPDMKPNDEINATGQPKDIYGVGAPKPGTFGDNDTTSIVSHTFSYLQTDFMWSPLVRSDRKRISDGKSKP